MVKERRWLWFVTVGLWSALLVASVVGIADASVVELGDIRFSFAQVTTLLLVGAAYGDLRQWRRSVDARLKHLEEQHDKEVA